MSSASGSEVAAIILVLRTGTSWELLPPEMGCGSGMTCARRLADADRLDWSRASLDSCSIPAQKGAKKPARIRSSPDSTALDASAYATNAAPSSTKHS